MTPLRLLLAFAAVACAGFASPPRGEVVETRYPDGRLHERFTVDAAGRKSGFHEEFRPDGTLIARTAFVADQKSGRAEEFAADGTTVIASGEYRTGQRNGAWTFVDLERGRRKKAEFAAGVLDGAVTISVGDKVVSRQRWKKGQIERLDDLVPFPITADALLAKLATVQAVPTPAPDTAKDPLARARSDALRRLQAYRALCGLSFEGITLVPEWNDLCQAAAEVCRANGAISHTPPKPAGFDDARYRQGQTGAQRSNLSVGTDLPGSIDGYMDDSDPSNVERVGHRRWCLNPPLGRTGFGAADSFSAMWSMDESGKGAKNLDAVLYPPAGHCPADMFGAQHAFSITLQKGGLPKPAEFQPRVRPLDDDFVAGEPLENDAQHLAPDGPGTGPCLIFRPKGLVVAPGRAYLVEVSTDGGKTKAFRYVVAFCAAAPLPAK